MIHRVSPFVFKDNEIESRLNKEAERPPRKLNVINERAINHVHLFLPTYRDPFSLLPQIERFLPLTSFRCIFQEKKNHRFFHPNFNTLFSPPSPFLKKHLDRELERSRWLITRLERYVEASSDDTSRKRSCERKTWRVERRRGTVR